MKYLRTEIYKSSIPEYKGKTIIYYLFKGFEIGQIF